MIPTPGHAVQAYGIGAVNYHTGDITLIVRNHKRRLEIAELLELLLEKHAESTIYVAWDNATSHVGTQIEAILQRAAGRLVLLYLPTYSPWLNPVEMLWRHYRREVTHNELFESLQHLITATLDFFARHRSFPERILSIIGNHSLNTS